MGAMEARRRAKLPGDKVSRTKAVKRKLGYRRCAEG